MKQEKKECICCYGTGIQQNKDNLRVICPACGGTGIMPEVTPGFVPIPVYVPQPYPVYIPRIPSWPCNPSPWYGYEVTCNDVTPLTRACINRNY
jgi:hypothetical protein